MHKVTEWFHRLQDVLNPCYNSVHKLKAFRPVCVWHCFSFCSFEIFCMVFKSIRCFHEIWYHHAIWFIWLRIYCSLFSLATLPYNKIPSFISLLCWESWQLFKVKKEIKHSCSWKLVNCSLGIDCPKLKLLMIMEFTLLLLHRSPTPHIHFHIYLDSVTGTF